MSGYTDIHGQYLSHRITLEGLDEDNFARSLSTARVDMNPHQVEAALFAFKSPLHKGVLLADEVGLGKTIEASLVIAQRWAERKRRILLIVPASLRKQWQQELSEKFSLSSMILEAKTYRDQVRAGKQRPFADSDGIIITSYEFAARKGDQLVAVPWGLVIYDEARRLRNVYRKNGSKWAKVLRDALKRPVDETVTDDIDSIEGLAEEFDEEACSDREPRIDAARLAAEIEELQGYLELAKSIGANAKGEKLIQRLPKAMDQIVSKGGRRKAVIFTESVRTQTYLAALLAANGFDGRIALMNGSNSDPGSKAIHAGWKDRHAGTDRISGSRSADMKAAIVEAFKGDEKSILIATESGAEGINLQFCSLLVNFDLPWNPRRVEQRIGGCHRYGQKIDVTVVNLLNRKNQAEARIYQLLDRKFRLFSGVFGSSDEILGTIEKGVDFERKVLEIVQSARDDEQVQLEFDLLTDAIRDNIDADMRSARAKLLEELDQDVVARLKDHEGSLTATLDDFARRLTMIARAELPDAVFGNRL